jgi:hypothetical protein
MNNTVVKFLINDIFVAEYDGYAAGLKYRNDGSEKS